MALITESCLYLTRTQHEFKVVPLHFFHCLWLLPSFCICLNCWSFLNYFNPASRIKMELAVMESKHCSGMLWGKPLLKHPALHDPGQTSASEKKWFMTPLKLLLKCSVLGRFMENLLKLSMLQGSSACEPVPGWELGAELAAAVLICVLLGRNSAGPWRWLWPAERGIRQEAAKCLSSFFLSLNHTGLEKKYKNVTVNSLQTIKMRGKYPATEKNPNTPKQKNLYC